MKTFDDRWKKIQAVVCTRFGKRLWWLTVKLYPFHMILENPSERCSLCRREWSNANGAINHVAGLPHFRQWCRENVEEAERRWDIEGQQIRVLVAEEILAGVNVTPDLLPT